MRTCFKLDVFLYWFYAFHYESDVLWRTCSSPKILKWICNFSVSNARMLAIIMGLQNNQNHMRFNCVVNHTSSIYWRKPSWNPFGWFWEKNSLLIDLIRKQKQKRIVNFGTWNSIQKTHIGVVVSLFFFCSSASWLPASSMGTITEILTEVSLQIV